MTALRFAAACAALVLAACAIGKPVPQAITYVVEPTPPVPVTPRRAETLRMGDVRVAPPFARRELVYRVGEVQYTADFYNAFIAEPGPLLGSTMAGWLNRSGSGVATSRGAGLLSIAEAGTTSSWALARAATRS